MRMSHWFPIMSGGGVQYTFSGTSSFSGDVAGDWELQLKTTGNLVFQSLKTPVDIFLVGGGAGGRTATNNQYTSYGGEGGSGGYTSLYSNQTLTLNTTYVATIGAGGSPGVGETNKSGGSTSLGSSYTCSGAYHIGTQDDGSNNMGGSGGGGGTHPDSSGLGNGGSDGSDGYRYQNYGYGKGMNTINGDSTTKWVRKFREAGATLFSGGGGAGGNSERYPGSGGSGGGGDGGTNGAGTQGTANTGGGGGGGGGKIKGGYAGAKGGSGIIIIRNHR